jgi:two-component system, NtrC family, sensor kinase
MSIVANDTVAGLRTTIAELRQQLDERSAELNEAVKQQSAMADVLQVINQSRGDLAPVFEAVLDKALGLCGAAFGILRTYDGARLQVAAFRGAPPAYAEHLRRAPPSVGLGPDNVLVRLLHGEPVVHIADAAEDRAYLSGDPLRRAVDAEERRGTWRPVTPCGTLAGSLLSWPIKETLYPPSGIG